jgi:UDP-N-acetylglucosamine--N-acetylmuramyl-(pentapeptide) pyrophosphoryl-undecaprenol N-acetylglucosamine transferase
VTTASALTALHRGSERALRVLSTANDGLSLGHATRSLAIARALRRAAAARELELELLMVTTSTADIADDVASVRLPHPASARAGGLSDGTRRRVARAAIDGIAEAFGPDLIVVDTFPSGPHGELAGLLRIDSKRALVRRHVREERARDDALTAGIERFDLVVAADDPEPYALDVQRVPVARVPPIVLEGEALSRSEARAALRIPLEARAILVACGGGGDGDAVARGERIAEMIAEAEPASVVVLARGPLAPASRRSPERVHRVSAQGPRSPLRTLRDAALAPLLLAFDAAFAPAGYNTAHELARSGVPFALHAEPRAFDDQAARRDRFAALGLAVALDHVDALAIQRALASMTGKPSASTRFAADGAGRAAEALLDLVGARRAEAAP